MVSSTGPARGGAGPVLGAPWALAWMMGTPGAPGEPLFTWGAGWRQPGARFLEFVGFCVGGKRAGYLVFQRGSD